MGISAVIHTYNSEKYLEECLDAIKCLDEIIICDMYSTDKTIEIAKKFGCVIVYHENVGYADPARNFAMSHVTNDWILVVDSDEMIPIELINYLKEWIKNPNCANALEIPRKNILLGKVLWSWYPNRIARFFRKGYVSWPDRVHVVPDVEGTIDRIDSRRTELAIIHYNYDSIESFISRLNKYSTLELEKYKDRNIKFSIGFLIMRPFLEFLKKFILKKGYKDGIHGFIFSVLQAVYKFVSIAKLWEYELNLNNKNKKSLNI